MDPVPLLPALDELVPDEAGQNKAQDDGDDLAQCQAPDFFALVHEAVPHPASQLHGPVRLDHVAMAARRWLAGSARLPLDGKEIARRPGRRPQGLDTLGQFGVRHPGPFTA